MQTNTKNTIETLDKLYIAQVDIRFMANLLNAWDIDKTAITYNDLHAMSRVCDKIDDKLVEVEFLLKKDLKE